MFKTRERGKNGRNWDPGAAFAGVVLAVSSGFSCGCCWGEAKGCPGVGGAAGVLAAGGLSSGAGRDRALLFTGEKKKEFSRKGLLPFFKKFR